MFAIETVDILIHLVKVSRLVKVSAERQRLVAQLVLKALSQLVNLFEICYSTEIQLIARTIGGE